MRILYWIGHMGDKFGSVERYNVLLAEKCQQRGHELVVMHDIPNTVPEYSQRLRAVRADLLVIGHTYADPLHALPRAARFVQSWKPDVVHVHFVNPLALLMLKMLHVPLIYQTWHNCIDHVIRLRTRLIRYAGNYCTRRMLAVSEGVRQDEIRAGVASKHIRTLYLGLPLSDFVNSASICQKPYPLGFNDPKLKVLITVARFYPQKGMQYVVDAAIRVVRQRTDVVWWLLGEGPEKEPLEALAQKAGADNRLAFLGVRNDVPSLVQRAYAQVVGSLYEGLPLMVLEASALGVPTVGTQIRGLDEATVDGLTGLLVPRKSSEALAQAALRLLDDRDLRDRLGQAAKAYTFEHFDSERLVDELLDMYESDLIQRARRPT